MIVDDDIVHLLYGAASFFVFVAVGVAAYLNREKLKHFKKYGWIGIFFMSVIGNITVLSPANTLVSFAGGKIYNPFLVGFVVAIGSILGEFLTYNLGVAGEVGIHHKDWYETAKQYFAKNGFLASLVITAIPNPLLNFVGIIAGSLNYPFWKFMIATFLGNWIQYTICALLGMKILK